METTRKLKSLPFADMVNLIKHVENLGAKRKAAIALEIPSSTQCAVHANTCVCWLHRTATRPTQCEGERFLKQVHSLNNVTMFYL